MLLLLDFICHFHAYQSVFLLPMVQSSMNTLPQPVIRHLSNHMGRSRQPPFSFSKVRFCPEVGPLRASPAGVFLFGRSFYFQGAVGLSIDKLSQVYTFLIACTVYPKGSKSARKTLYFHALGIMIE